MDLDRIAQRAFRKRQKAHLEEASLEAVYQCNLLTDTTQIQLEAEVIDKGMRIREINENNGLLLETMKQLQNQNVEVSQAL
jgi:hypothetical protein